MYSYNEVRCDTVVSLSKPFVFSLSNKLTLKERIRESVYNRTKILVQANTSEHPLWFIKFPQLIKSNQTKSKQMWSWLSRLYIYTHFISSVTWTPLITPICKRENRPSLPFFQTRTTYAHSCVQGSRFQLMWLQSNKSPNIRNFPKFRLSYNLAKH